MELVWILVATCVTLGAAHSPNFDYFNQQQEHQRDHQQNNNRYPTKEEIAIAQARLAEEMRQEWYPTQREPATLFDRGWRDSVNEYSGRYGDDEDRNYDDNDEYYDDGEYYDEEYQEENDFFDKEELDAIDKETIANNENEIYRVKADLEYDEMRMERMSRKMAAMERNMQKMQVALESKYPFGGYYKK